MAGVRRSVQRPGGADRSQHRPLRGRVARGQSGHASPARRCGGRGIARAWADATAGQDRASRRRRVDVALGRRTARPWLPRAAQAAAGGRLAGRSYRPRAGSRGGVGAARRPPIRRGTPPTSEARSSSSSRAATSSSTPVVRRELAEDLTARTVARVRPADRPTRGSRARPRAHLAHVLDVEADLTDAPRRIAPRTPRARLDPIATDAESGLDDRSSERSCARSLAGADLVVIEGAAGAGKTTTLAAARTAIEQHGGRLRVVTPTLKAARVAAEQVGGDASSAAWLAYQHGFRWDENGTWTRLALGDIDPDTGVVYARPDAPQPCSPRVTYCSSTRPACSTRTPPARC